MVKEDKNLTGNARYEGFCIDLLRWIAGQVGFNYEIRLVPDRMYGVLDQSTKEWNGIVRELMDKVCGPEKVLSDMTWRTSAPPVRNIWILILPRFLFIHRFRGGVNNIGCYIGITCCRNASSSAAVHAIRPLFNEFITVALRKDQL